jgi:hypothetical protein
MADIVTLYGAPFSLYTGKARAYLIKQGIPFKEVAPKTPHFYGHVMPTAHRWRLPTIELPGGEVIQDSMETN